LSDRKASSVDCLRTSSVAVQKSVSLSPHVLHADF
jgi:hypothetical protein